MAKQIVYGYPGNARIIKTLYPKKDETEREYRNRCWYEYLNALNHYENPGDGKKIYMNDI
jgi:hypothetical protein